LLHPAGVGILASPQDLSRRSKHLHNETRVGWRSKVRTIQINSPVRMLRAKQIIRRALHPFEQFGAVIVAGLRSQIPCSHSGKIAGGYSHRGDSMLIEPASVCLLLREL